jgi:hypothetical protein
MKQLEKLTNEYTAASDTVGNAYQLECKAFIAGFKAARIIAYEMCLKSFGVRLVDLQEMGEEEVHD